MKHRVITISREFGSGGRTIGKKVAETLQIPCYDSELIQKIAQESDFAEGYVKEVDESSKGGLSLGDTTQGDSRIGGTGALCHRGQMRGLYSTGGGRLPHGLYPRQYAVPGG